MVVGGFRSFHALVFTESRRHARRRRIQDGGVIDFQRGFRMVRKHFGG